MIKVLNLIHKRVFVFFLLLVVMSVYPVLAFEKYIKIGETWDTSAICGADYDAGCSRDNEDYVVCQVEEGVTYTVWSSDSPVTRYWYSSGSILNFFNEGMSDNKMYADVTFPLVDETTFVTVYAQTPGGTWSSCADFEILDVMPVKHECFVLNTTHCGDVDFDTLTSYYNFVDSQGDTDLQAGHSWTGNIWGYIEASRLVDIIGPGPLLLLGTSFISPDMSISDVAATFPTTQAGVVTVVNSSLSLTTGTIWHDPSETVVVDDNLSVSGSLSHSVGSILVFPENVEMYEGLEVFGLSTLTIVPLLENYDANYNYFFTMDIPNFLPDDSCYCDLEPDAADCSTSFPASGYTYNRCYDEFFNGEETNWNIFQRIVTYLDTQINPDVNPLPDPTLDITGNLDAGSITLGGIKRSSWPSSDQFGIDNLVNDPGFEFFSGWTNTGDDGSGFSEARAHSGVYSGKLISSSGEEYWWSEKIPININEQTQFTLSGWYYLESGPSVELFLFWYTSSTPDDDHYPTGAWDGNSVLDNTVGAWTRFYLSTTVSPDVVELGVRLDVNGAGSVFFDDIQLVEGNQLSKFKPRTLNLEGDAGFNNVDVREDLDVEGRVMAWSGANIRTSGVGAVGLLADGNIKAGTLLGDLNLKVACDPMSNLVRENNRGLVLSFASQANLCQGYELCEDDSFCDAGMSCVDNFCIESSCQNTVDDDDDDTFDYCDSDCPVCDSGERLGCARCGICTVLTPISIEEGESVTFSLDITEGTSGDDCSIYSGVGNIHDTSGCADRTHSFSYANAGIYSPYVEELSADGVVDKISCPTITVGGLETDCNNGVSDEVFGLPGYDDDIDYCDLECNCATGDRLGCTLCASCVPSATSVPLGQSVTFNINFTSGYSTIIVAHAVFGDGVSSTDVGRTNGQGFSHTYTSAGSYVTTIHEINTDGVVDSITCPTVTVLSEAGLCNDGDDNDGDGATDYSDSECPCPAPRNKYLNSCYECTVVPSTANTGESITFTLSRVGGTDPPLSIDNPPNTAFFKDSGDTPPGDAQYFWGTGTSSWATTASYSTAVEHTAVFQDTTNYDVIAECPPVNVVEEDCNLVGDEDDNGLADFDDPVCPDCPDDATQYGSSVCLRCEIDGDGTSSVSGLVSDTFTFTLAKYGPGSEPFATADFYKHTTDGSPVQTNVAVSGYDYSFPSMSSYTPKFNIPYTGSVLDACPSVSIVECVMANDCPGRTSTNGIICRYDVGYENTCCDSVSCSESNNDECGSHAAGCGLGFVSCGTCTPPAECYERVGIRNICVDCSDDTWGDCSANYAVSSECSICSPPQTKCNLNVIAATNTCTSPCSSTSYTMCGTPGACDCAMLGAN
ncbi:hypothetical protein HQ533_04655 [Candidatus Woesearchaeota archaeon]|nr:hypothetical protein [Candidatus Woesearchaeota archaeon]